MPSLTSKRFLFRLSIAGVFLIAIRFFIGWGHIKTPTYSLSTGSQAEDTTTSESTHHATTLTTTTTEEALSKPSPDKDVLFDNENEGKPKQEGDDKGNGGDDKDGENEGGVSTSHGDSASAETIPDELKEKVTKYVEAILDPNNTAVDRLTCPQFDADRYAHLQIPSGEHRHKYFIALNLRQCADLLPRLMGSVMEAIRFLGPQNTVLSIVEGNSDDGTLEVLAALKVEFANLEVRYFLRRDGLDPIGSEDRIGNLALLRSMAIEPLKNSRNKETTSTSMPGSDLDFDDDAVVIFLNDVAACTEDILELLHQRIVQNADMTCAMDWYHPGGKDHPSIFYDVWISRTLSGNLFFDIDTTGSWDKSEIIFPYEADADARTRFEFHRPFQVFACWNGGVTFSAKPLLDGAIDFRRAHDPECFQGEPQLFCKDMWFHGYGRIAVVPSVNLEYSNEAGRWVKDSRGYVRDWVAMEDETDGDMKDAPPKRIEWKDPPEQVKCVPMWSSQTWLPWNESLPLVAT